MTGFYILGALALLILLGMWLHDYAYKKGHDYGFEKGLRVNVEETYLQGATDAENFMVRAEADVRETQRQIWGEEMEA